MSCLRARLRDEGGQILILTSAVIIAMLFMGTVVVDVGNWYVHRRHLQTQVDAAALAAARDFTGCFLADQSAANTNVANSALLYAGDININRQPLAFNPQVTPDTGNGTGVHVVLNADDYWPTATTDGWTAANPLGWSALGLAGDAQKPCKLGYIDVKATDDDVPGLLRLIPFRPDIHATARLEIQTLTQTSGMLPWAIPEEDARWVDIVFFNEQTLGSLSVQPLLASTNSETLNGARVLRWTGQAGGVAVAANTGVVVVTSRNATPIKTTGLTDLQALCSQTPVVHCYSGASASASLALVKGYGTLAVGLPGAAVLRDVIVNAGNCTQDQSAGYFVNVGGCSPQVEAVVDFGLGIGISPATINAKVALNGVRMTWSPGGTGGAYGTWTVAAPTLAAGSGQNTYSMQWSSGTGGLASFTGPIASSTQRVLAAAQAPAPNVIAVMKSIPNDPAATPTSFQFTVSNPNQTMNFAAGGSNNVTVSNGQHDVTEAAATNYVTTYTNTRNGNPNCANLQGGDSCTITNTARGTINVIKTVAGGGTLTASGTQISVTGTGLNPSVTSPFAGTGAPGRAVVINANIPYAVTEAPVLDYSPTYSPECKGSVNRGQTVTCTITNTYSPASPATVKVIKSVVGGTTPASGFTITAASTGGTAAPASFAGSATGQDVSVSASRPYAITEPAPVTNYTVSYSPGCSGTLAPSQTATCIVTNTYNYGTLTVIKQVSGGAKIPSDFQINVNVSGGGNAVPATFQGSTAGQVVRVDTGKTYTVSEPATTGYTATYSAGCSGVFTAGDAATCTVTNVFGSVGPPASGSFGIVARPYATNTASGPVAYLRVLDQASQAPEYFLQSGVHDFTVEVGLKAPLQVDQPGAKPILLRLTNGPSSSLTQSIDCDRDSLNYPAPFDTLPSDAAEIGYGCLTTYQTNPTGDCTAYDPGGVKLPPTGPPPPKCAITKQGQVTSLDKGLSARFENPCTPNNWPKTATDPAPSPRDPRWVTLVVTDFGAFNSNGGTVVPVRKFAAFYVTGWDVANSGETNGCDANDLHPDQPNIDTNGDGKVDRFDYKNSDDGDVWGHFGNYVANNGTSDGTACDFKDSQACVGVLTR